MMNARSETAWGGRSGVATEGPSGPRANWGTSRRYGSDQTGSDQHRCDQAGLDFRPGNFGLRSPDSGSLAPSAIARYIFATTFSAFAIVLFSLTAVIWITQALRDIDLMTSRGQTVLVFLGITGLVIPMLVLVIAPIALMIAVMHAIGRLSNDSELIVMNAAGMSPWVLFRPFLYLAVFVSLIMSVIGAWLGPLGLQTLNDWANDVRADLVTNIVQPGRFNGFERGLTFHVRERLPNGQLLGVFVDDRRSPDRARHFPCRARHHREGRARHIPDPRNRQRAAA